MSRARYAFGEVGIPVLLFALGCALASAAPSSGNRGLPITVPITLDHNRMLVEAEFEREDGGRRRTRLWVDTGAPDFYMSETLARDLGIDLVPAGNGAGRDRLAIAPPTVRIGGVLLDFEGVESSVLIQPGWLFHTVPAEANLPATVLKRYQVALDYPERLLTLAAPGSLEPRGRRIPAAVNDQTGIVQIDAVIDGEDFSFALDNGASYSFISADVLSRLIEKHPRWPRIHGAVGCANIWGWWPEEADWTVARLPKIRSGSVTLSGVGLVGLPAFFESGASLGIWYSKKTTHPVQGFLGPNAFEGYRVEIDYRNRAVYFEKGATVAAPDMDVVGLTIRREPDGNYQVIGVARMDGPPVVEGVEPGFTLVRVDGLVAKSASMGTVVDALRGKPGEIRTLILDRAGKRIEVKAPVKRLL